MGTSDGSGPWRCFEVDRRDLGVTRLLEAESRPPRARDARSWLNVVRHPGLDAVDGLYRSWLSNSVSSPAEAHLIEVTARDRDGRP